MSDIKSSNTDNAGGTAHPATAPLRDEGGMTFEEWIADQKDYDRAWRIPFIEALRRAWNAARQTNRVETRPGWINDATGETVTVKDSRWISVTDRMPKPNVLVLAFFLNVLGNRRIIRAQYAPAGSLQVGDDADGTYDEKTDTYCCAEGWYGDNEYEETHWQVSDEVTHWRPLPAPPEQTTARSAETTKDMAD